MGTALPPRIYDTERTADSKSISSFEKIGVFQQNRPLAARHAIDFLLN